MLVISDDGKEILIPIETHFIVDLSTTNKSIIMDLPEGLIDLNE
jgi:ribosomal 30S subunit maturation factor RimM